MKSRSVRQPGAVGGPSGEHLQPVGERGEDGLQVSLAALGEPGRFTMSVPFRMPAAARDSMARFVTCMEA